MNKKAVSKLLILGVVIVAVVVVGVVAYWMLANPCWNRRTNWR
ncbi:MAG: hypothetical protein NWF09_01005 [Candidatus Bathyarchaeota archaeon]|nr:hypothetical protein [Candidatus Bathyarchaeota archaeon]